MAYDNCSECEHYNKDSCPLSALSDRLKQQFCPRLKLRLIDNTRIDNQVNKMAASIQKRLDVIHQRLFPETRPMDYSRDDTKEIVNSMKPFNN